jgi:Protein of unknown function (DUF1592)/Protein of unknown function (DUF1588)/Protein of unknown function (DUF1587)/Protein of unknown function (DUF1585)/Protein of unknown function (DUF1595)/Planctomycete cytochrome C
LVLAMMRPRVCLGVLGLCIGTVAIWLPFSARSQPEPASDSGLAQFDGGLRETIKPFLATYCSECHSGQNPKAELDLSSFATVDSIAKNLHRWETVLEQLEGGRMPPVKAKAHPPSELRQQVVAWVREVRKHEAKRNAGDPGPVPPRRLSNAEYDNTIRDLIGVDIRPAQEFPVDPANEAGFDNSAESLAMSSSLLNKYLDAARKVSEHIVFLPEGFTFAPYPVVADTDRDKFCVRRIIDFYKRQRTDYADYFLAAWRFQHREASGQPKANLADAAAEAGVSVKYLAAVWNILTGPPQDLGPVAALQTLWRELPQSDTENNKAAVRAGCEQMRDFVLQLREKLVPEVRNLTGRPMHQGSQPLVMWKNRQMAANRMRYAGGALKLQLDKLAASPAAAHTLAAPTDPDEVKQYEAACASFCATFPDAFFVSERARVYLNPEGEKKLTGRLLNAGFHSMTGYFRDDGPLYELMLSPDQQRELDRLWLEFDVITGAPMRQHTSLIWFERSDSSFMRGTEFDFARAEDKDCTSEAKIKKLSELWIAKARKSGASEVALGAVKDHFEIISASIRRVEKTRLLAEPSHLNALQAFAERAYRRPLSAWERDDLVSFYHSARDKEGLGHEDAVRDALVSVLVSPHFLLRIPSTASIAAGRGGRWQPLSDYALANRLSYFLWSSMPDAELLAHATAGDLHQPEVLNGQAKRMLRDDRVRGLAMEFAGNWLDFRRFEEHNAVDRARFPGFTDELRRAMFEEPLQFFMDVARTDRSVLDFLYADHTFVNPVLARHYGMPEPKNGPHDWQRIDGAARYGRGGLLPMAVFLTKNAPGLRTSPVKRGYWVVRRVLGEKIPAPPAEVPELPADEAKLGELTLREVLARHRADKSCAGCHDRFDALGLAFEGYGPVGELRTTDLGGRPVDARASFPGGGEGAGLDGLLAYLKARRQEEFADNLCRKLLAYALGRTLLASDDELVEEMRRKLAANGYRFGTLVESIVKSTQFLNRRGNG